MVFQQYYFRSVRYAVRLKIDNEVASAISVSLSVDCTSTWIYMTWRGFQSFIVVTGFVTGKNEHKSNDYFCTSEIT